MRERLLPAAELFVPKSNLSVSAMPSQLPYQGSQGRLYNRFHQVKRWASLMAWTRRASSRQQAANSASSSWAA